ncbi:MAG: hypothetical protein ACP5IN_07795, partial [Caldimicrobium sp.]
QKEDKIYYFDSKAHLIPPLYNFFYSHLSHTSMHPNPREFFAPRPASKAIKKTPQEVLIQKFHPTLL